MDTPDTPSAQDCGGDLPELPELVSARGAATIMAAADVDRETCRRVLKAGLAGAPTVVGRTHLYARSRVEELTRWPLVDAGDSRLSDACHRGTFVARLGPRRAVVPGDGGTGVAWVGADVSAPWEEQLLAASGPWRISVWGVMVLDGRARREGSVPFVATVGGFVVLTADLVGVRRPGRPVVRADAATGSRRVRHQPAVLTLSRPTGWAEGWRGHRVLTGRGGPWLMWPDGLWPG